VIDELLVSAIEDGRVSQVIEVACGMAPRGWRFAQRYGGELTYIEADLPEMAERKRHALRGTGSLGDAHQVVPVDALSDDGPESLAAVAAPLDPESGLAIITEGLLTYFDHGNVLGMWRRFSDVLGRFRHGLYLADVRLDDPHRAAAERAFSALLSTFVARRVHTHFSDERAAVRALREAGFADGELCRPDRHPAAGPARRDPASARIHIISASR
jgi:O-methyltransferase involved in polyketide biosynthesis